MYVSVLDFQAWIQIRLDHIPGNLSVLAQSMSRKDRVFQLNEFESSVESGVQSSLLASIIDGFLSNKLNHKFQCVSPVLN